MSELQDRDVLSLRNINRKEIERIFDLSDKIDTRKKYDVLEDKILASLFFEPSTRTRLSFEAAMHRLGGDVIGWADPKMSRAGSPLDLETMEDTARIVSNYADVIVMRHPTPGAPDLVSKYAEIPVINAGDGDNEHPTQALIDLYAIKRIKGKIDGLKICLAGNLRYLRCLHSDAYGLANFDVELRLVSPPDFKMPQSIINYLQERNVLFKEATDLDRAMAEVDVLIVDSFLHKALVHFGQYDRIRIQRLKDYYTLDPERMKKANQGLIVLHSLPRTGELGFDITPEVDAAPCAKYFEQASYGMNIRMALFSLILGKSQKKVKGSMHGR
jgi:aspartate carbamoyltransferase catalytic subunit